MLARRSSGRARGFSLGLACAAWIAVGCLCPAAGRATQVYHSPNDDGLPAAGPPQVLEGGVRPVHLYIDGGALASAAGTACDTGSGDEVCGFTLALTGQAGLTLIGFTPDAGANLLYDVSALEFRVNGLDTASPTPGPKRIGELSVNAIAGGSLELTSGEVVDAGLSAEQLESGEIVAFPEPGEGLQLAVGIALLAGFARRRAKP